MCGAHERVLVTSQRGSYPHRDAGVEGRRVFHQLRSRAIENFNGQFKAIFDCQRQVPTRGLRHTQRFVLGAVLVYHLTLLYRAQAGADLRRGLKPCLQAASSGTERGRVTTMEKVAPANGGHKQL